MIDPPTIEAIIVVRLAKLPSFVCGAGAHGWSYPAHIHTESAYDVAPVQEGQWILIDSASGVHLLATIWERQ